MKGRDYTPINTCMKSIFKSKTFWLAATQAVAGGLVIFFTEIDALGYVAIVKSVADIVLRLISTEEVTF